MDLLFDPSIQVGNPILLLLERAFYGGLAIFFFGALSKAIKRGMRKNGEWESNIFNCYCDTFEK